MRLELETSLARAAGRLSRLAGQGGGTTLPGKLLTAIDPGAIARLAKRLPEGSAILSATNGKTTSAAMSFSDSLAPLPPRPQRRGRESRIGRGFRAHRRP